MERPVTENSDLVASRKLRGRPRDAEVDARILHAAVRVFAAEGWRGFHLEAVAKAAGVGKSTIYLRWSTREQLISDALEAYGREWDDIDSGNIRDDLRSIALAWGQKMDNTNGPLGLRIFLETFMNPEFAAVSATMRQTAITGSHRVVQRAKRRGQLRRDVSSAVLLDALLGGMINHMSTYSPQVPGGLYFSEAGVAFIDRLVDLVLEGQTISTES